MTTTRKISQVFKSVATIEGAGVHLKRAFGYRQGPIVINTREELPTLFAEYHNGTFVK